MFKFKRSIFIAILIFLSFITWIFYILQNFIPQDIFTSNTALEDVNTSRLMSNDPVTINGSNDHIKAQFYLLSDIEDDNNLIIELCLAGVDEHTSQFSKLMILGDLTSLGVYDSLVRLKTELMKCPIGFYVIPGDRDIYTANGTQYFNEIFDRDYYYVDEYKFLFINNADEYSGISDEQFDFIKANIDSADFVFLHNPIYYSQNLFDSFFKKGMGQYDDEVEEQRKKLLQIIRDSNVKAVFAGDRHFYSEQVDDQKDTLTHYVIGSANKNRSIGQASYAIFTIYQDGSFAVKNIFVD